jgi:GTP-binding protein
MAAYGHGLGEKPEIVALSRVDAVPADRLAEARAAVERAAGGPVLAISAATGEGIDALLDQCLGLLDRTRANAALPDTRRSVP